MALQLRRAGTPHSLSSPSLSSIAAWVAAPAACATTRRPISTGRAAVHPRPNPPRHFASRSSAGSQTNNPDRHRRPSPAIQYRPAPSGNRTYHSYDHASAANPFSAAEQALLAAAYAHVPEHGFSQLALARGARDAGYLDISPSILPDGAFALVRWHLIIQRLALSERRKELFGADDDPADVRRKAEGLAWARLLGNKVVIGRWQEALAIMAQPSYARASVKELALLADEILFLAGDPSIDPSWYTKRAALSAIYASAELFMTGDTSEGFRDTQAFLHRRLDEARSLGGFVESVGEWVGFTAQAGVNVLRSKGPRI